MQRRGRRPSAAQLALFDPAGCGVPAPSHPWGGGELLAFDLETTGTDRFIDVPVSFAFVWMREGRVIDRLSALVDPGRPIPLEAVAVHGITGPECSREGMRLEDAAELITTVLVDASRCATPLVGMKLDFDLTIIDVLCRANSGRGLADRGWDGPVLDALVLDRHLDPAREGSRSLVALCAHYGVPIARPHSAPCDAEAALRVVLEMGRRFEALAVATPSKLHRDQVRYHRRWATAFDERRRRRALPPLDESEWDWPVASSRGRALGVA